MKTETGIVPIIIVLLVIAAGIYWFFFTGTGNQLPLTGSSPVTQAQNEFQTLVGELTPISFDTDIFSDARFNALVDITTPIIPEPSGHLDPFSATAGSVVSTTSVSRH